MSTRANSPQAKDIAYHLHPYDLVSRFLGRKARAGDAGASSRVPDAPRKRETRPGGRPSEPPGGVARHLEALDITPGQFTERLVDSVPIWSFWVGMIKAPVFAFLIAMVGCFEGLQVAGSAESVGRHTTKSVVEAIFLVIIFDAAFSILFSYIGV